MSQSEYDEKVQCITCLKYLSRNYIKIHNRKVHGPLSADPAFNNKLKKKTSKKIDLVWNNNPPDFSPIRKIPSGKKKSSLGLLPRIDKHKKSGDAKFPPTETSQLKVKWLYQDEDMNWIEFNQTGVTSSIIESFYKKYPEKDFHFVSSNGQSCMLDFGLKVQINKQDGKWTSIKREENDGVVKTVQATNAPSQSTVTWYFKDELLLWQKYGEENSLCTETDPVTSTAIEKYYQKDRSNFFFTLNSFQYLVDFKNMQQKNMETGTVREIKRVSGPVSDLPVHWDEMSADELLRIVTVDAESSEFSDVAKLFEDSSGGFKCKDIKRIQNSKIWRIFNLHKESMLLNYNRDKEKVNEQLLFHGSRYDLIDLISSENLDLRKRGVHGVAFGHGVYFAKQASYSIQFAQPTRGQNNRALFLFRVLVGTVTHGNSTMLHPPYTRDDPKVQYDSTVDCEHNPSVFVKFYDHTFYPEYIIEF